MFLRGLNPELLRLSSRVSSELTAEWLLVSQVSHCPARSSFRSEIRWDLISEPWLDFREAHFCCKFFSLERIRNYCSLAWNIPERGSMDNQSFVGSDIL